MEYRGKYFSKDGSIKYLLDVKARSPFIPTDIHTLSIESAFIPLKSRKEDKPENVLCLSSQIGCAYKCYICANSRATFYRCLTPKEINEQISLTLQQDNNLDRVKKSGRVEYAFMAIGEPLYGNNVIHAIQQHDAFVPGTFFSLSTIGAEGYVKRLSQANLPYPVRLELSLHFPNDKLRNWWMPHDMLFGFNKTPVRNIETMLNEAEEYSKKHPGKVTLNYTMIDGINNTDESLDQLSKLLKNRKGIFYVKLMRPNLTSSMVYSWKEEEGVSRTYNPKQFKNLLEQLGIEVTTFESKGQDILAGCGMMTTRFDTARGVLQQPHVPEAKQELIGF
jgi:23S rRNA (adenine2503-C2)-methyltransferase